MFCSGDHAINNCTESLSLSKSERLDKVRKFGICTNCLRSSNHRTSKCPGRLYKVCSGRHNTLLHLGQGFSSKPKSENQVPRVDAVKDSHSNESQVARHSSVVLTSESMLSTAIIDVLDSQGNKLSARVLLDPGSQASFITENLFNKLNVTSKSVNISVVGISRSTSSATRVAKINFQSRFMKFNSSLNCIITKVITNKIPSVSLNPRIIRIPKGLVLADPKFYASSEIDILIGVDSF